MLIDLLTLERGEGGEKASEGNIGVRENMDWVPSICAPTGDGTPFLGMCHDLELNL